MSEAYVVIRDDSGIRSLSTNERDFLRSCANSSNILRVDGRRGNEHRKVRLHLGRWDNGAECTVQWGGGTRVTSLCTADLVPPSPDRPNEGMVNFMVELSPMAGSSYRQAPAISNGPTMNSTSRGPNYADQKQRLLTNRILRSVERIILLGGALDTEALVLAPGKWVWRLTVALTVLDDGGNVLDASIMAAIAALRHYRKPQVDFSDDNNAEASDTVLLPSMIPSSVKEAIPLPLHHTPLSASFALIPTDESSSSSSSTSSIVTALIDPTDREELVEFGNLTIAMNIHAEVCLLDYGGGCEITPSKLKECWKAAETCIKGLCQMLEQSLKEADEQAHQERLERLQHQQHNTTLATSLPPPPNTPYFVDDSNNEMEIKVDNVNSDQLSDAQTKAEEAWRRQALDYSQGHVASKVREDNAGKSKSSAQKKAATLLASMLKSVSQMDVSADNENNDDKMETSDPSGPSRTSQEATEANVGEESPANSMKTDKPDKEEPLSESAKQTVAMDTDDDEEEAPTVLHSEFQPLPAKTDEKEKLATSEPEEDVDLSMAIKKKKKKSKKKK